MRDHLWEDVLRLVTEQTVYRKNLPAQKKFGLDAEGNATLPAATYRTKQKLANF